MRRLWLAYMILFALSGLLLQAQNPAPTLVPPTPIPREEAPPTDSPLTVSTVQRIRERGVMRVGVLFNEPPYSSFGLRGEVVGYEPALARAMAELWGIEVEFVQVTRINRIDLLRAGTVDLLMATVVQDRDLESQVTFSQPYRVERQAMLVREDSNARTPSNLAGLPVGVVVGTPTELALAEWQTRTGVPLVIRTYFTLDRAYSALFAGEIEGVAGRDTHLRQVAGGQLEAIRILDNPLVQEPVGVAMLRGDVAMRDLVNRTLQHLRTPETIGGRNRLDDLHTESFSGQTLPPDALPLYANVPAPSLEDSDTSVVASSSATLQRVQSTGVVRVAGAVNVDPNGPQSVQRVAQVNRAIAEQIAQRWGVGVQYVDGDPVGAVANGVADLGVGVAPDWDVAGQVNYSQPYALHGYRLLARADRDLLNFSSLRGRIIGVLEDDPAAEDVATAWAESIRVGLRAFFRTDEENIARTILADRNADVVFADSLAIVAHAQANRDDLELGPRWYSREYLVLATPRDDLDVLRLVNYTLQEMARETVLNTVQAPITLPGEGNLRPVIQPGLDALGTFGLSR